MNRLALNVGYHNEHHDFPSVPWNRLPRIQRMAPEFYDSLVPSHCWSWLWLKFICDPRYSLYSRVIRAKSG
jgi:sphingolipid delta-4 desaturase